MDSYREGVDATPMQVFRPRRLIGSDLAGPLLSPSARLYVIMRSGVNLV